MPWVRFDDGSKGWVDDLAAEWLAIRPSLTTAPEQIEPKPIGLIAAEPPPKRKCIPRKHIDWFKRNSCPQCEMRFGLQISLRFHLRQTICGHLSKLQKKAAKLVAPAREAKSSNLVEIKQGRRKAS